MNTQDATYKELIALRDRLDARHSELMSEVEDVSRKLESVSTTLALLEGNEMPLAHRVATHATLHNAALTPPIDIESLRGLTQAQALEKLAEHGNGRFETTYAKKLLLRAGLIKNAKNASNIIYNVIQRSGKFERVEPGIYRLAGNKPDAPVRLTLPGIQTS